MRTRYYFYALIIVAALAASFFIYQPEKLDNITKNISSFSNTISNTVSNSGPLVFLSEKSGADLNAQNVFAFTNIERVNLKQTPLKSNPVLDTIASERNNDMFTHQYFEHVSSTGHSASVVAEDIGYEYISIGENIAMGNFESDEALVQAWMNSPGHKANILSDAYTELGVAVKKGEFEGNTVWIATQIFGRPLSDCTQASEKDKKIIESNKAVIDQLSVKENSLKEQLDSAYLKSRPEQYNAVVKEYNSLINQLNTLVATTKTLTDSYNNQIKAFNNCIK